MTRPLNRLLTTIIFFIPLGVWAQKNSLKTAKEPAWITSTKYDYSQTQMDKDAEDGYADLVSERQISLQYQTVYIKSAARIISEAGVQNHSEISVNFDPSYSQLTFHTVRVIRKGESINHLNVSKFRMVHQETELNRYLYNGTVTAILFMEDIRKGDIIEYSYSISGFNPVFKNTFSTWLEANFRVPLYNVFYKIVVPKGRSVRIKNFGCDKIPSTQSSNDGLAYEWRFTNVPAFRPEENVPTWYDPFASVLISENKSWQEVNDWAKTLFPFNIKLSPALTKKIAEIKNASSDKHEQTLAALHFVQDEVRYLGIEMGAGSHRPNHPNKVHAQRFGDCKDKSYLLCTMLKAMDIEADPVLISTYYKKEITKWLPTAKAFDHVTVRVKLDEKYYWFDATIPYQRGTLEDIDYPDYQCGLVITDSTTALTEIPNRNKGLVDIKEEFTVPNLSGPARLKVKTLYSGSYADDQRDAFNSSSIYEIERRFEKFYTNFFEKIKIDSISYTNDEKSGLFITIEYYTIPDFWELEKGVSKTNVSPFVIRGVLTEPSTAERDMPFRIQHPANYREEVLVNLPYEWDVTRNVGNISCAPFKLHYDFSYTYKKIRLQCEYKALKDHVSADESQAFYSSYKKVDKNINYELTYNNIKSMTPVPITENSSDWASIISLLLIVGGVIATIMWQTRRRSS